MGDDDRGAEEDTSHSGGHFMPRDPVILPRGGHLGGAGKYIEMERLDKVVNMEEGSRSLHTELPEMLGGALQTDHVLRDHARLKRMAAFDSHDYDPMDNDVEEEARRSRKRSEYNAEETWKWGMSVLIGVVMGFIAFTVDGLIDKLNAFKFGTVTGLIESSVAAFPTWLAFVCVSCFLVMFAGCCVSYIEPLAAGRAARFTATGERRRVLTSSSADDSTRP